MKYCGANSFRVILVLWLNSSYSGNLQFIAVLSYKLFYFSTWYENKKKLCCFFTEDKEFDVHNDFQREISFYEQAKDAAIIALERLHKAGIKTLRPDDYFAEMAKKDDHMKRVNVL